MGKLLNSGKKEVPLKSECTRIPWSLVKQRRTSILVSPLKCKSWHCETCGPRRQKQLKHTARIGNPNKFITLTASPESGSTPDEQARNLRSAWRVVRRKANKKWNQGKIEFLAVFETTEAGAPHLHILARTKYIHQAWLSKEMNSLTASPIVDIRRVRSKRHAAWYVSKYISKAPERFQGCKRYWKTMEWCAPKVKGSLGPDGQPDVYYIARAKAEKVKAYMIRRGFTLRSTAPDSPLEWSKDKPPPIRPGHLFEANYCPTLARYTTR